MKWSKLKSLIETRFADSVKGRIEINSTRYGNCSCGHAWLTLDGELVANFCTRAYWNKKLYEKSHGEPLPEKHKTKFKEQPVEYGEMSRQDVYKACWEFVHDLSIQQALSDDDPLIQTLAVLDKRLGKRRLSAIDGEKLHPLAKKMFLLRTSIESN